MCGVMRPNPFPEALATQQVAFKGKVLVAQCTCKLSATTERAGSIFGTHRLILAGKHRAAAPRKQSPSFSNLGTWMLQDPV